MKKLEELGKEIEKRLRLIIEIPKSELNFNTTFELLIAVMLSAQCTDKRVNIITSELFKKYNTPEEISALTLEQLENDIKSCNYYHNKAKNIISASKQIVENFGGVVPSEHSALTTLSGVGDKTANVVQAVGFGIPALPVDTHVLRVSNRLGLVKTSDPHKCEQLLKNIFKKDTWIDMHHLLLLFGRYYCTARIPKCDSCVLCDICKNCLKKEK